jgi:hypothetical protein
MCSRACCKDATYNKLLNTLHHVLLLELSLHFHWPHRGQKQDALGVTEICKFTDDWFVHAL